MLTPNNIQTFFVDEIEAAVETDVRQVGAVRRRLVRRVARIHVGPSDGCLSH
jgi:hypothetical protein